MLQFRSMEKRAAALNSSSFLLMILLIFYFHCGENEKIISISHLDTENLMFFSVAQWVFCQSDVCFAIYLGIS